MSFNYDFSRTTSRGSLLAALSIDEALFTQVLDFVPPPPAWSVPPSPPDEISKLMLPAFLRHDIPKRNTKRGHRTVWEPVLAKGTYKALGRRLDSFFRHKLDGYPHKSSFGYRPGRNIRENAAVHRGKKFLLSLDLQDFFPSISRSRIAATFEHLGIAPDIAALLARFVTISDALAMGLPTSPTISNAVALCLDQALEELALRSGAVYTRYSDDISISSDNALPDLALIAQIVSDNDFKLADEKTRLSVRGQAHYVTGLSISDPNQPHVPKAKKRRLRQELYYARKFGLGQHLHCQGINDPTVVQQEVNRLDGMIKFVGHHEPKLSSIIKQQWREILNAADMKPSFAPRGMHRAPFVLVIDEAEFSRDDQTYLALCIVVSQHIDRIAEETGRVLSNALNDLWGDGNRNALLARGLHFTDATKDLQLNYIKELATMPFEGYIAFCAYDGPKNYQATYLRLLSTMIPRRLIAAESQYAAILIEQNSKVSQTAIAECISNAAADLKRTNNRRPKDTLVKFLSKPDPLLSPPDFLLGVLGQYLKSKPAVPEPRERLSFERLRDKYRLILDLDTCAEYSRRRPIAPW
ncbi:reverse transcriptase family protein [Rhizobium sp. 11515TR]|uniref:reverse transcriptase family protein n=1 Tax=Rhizobium sp. 11515TR TaxID=2028343 RepID=UPI000BA883CE|nr:reverse transcriptase family protein [Rhizobium sp. 11515TR]ASW09556.1 RNA-directed DNA polymerase [Rhizobium sp. 11515TR]